MERTFVIVKPDGVERNLVGEVVRRFEEAGLRIVAMKMMRADKELVEKHYPDWIAERLGKKSARAGAEVKDFKAQGMKIVSWLRDYMIEGPVVAMILEGEDASKRVKELTGYTDPHEAEKGTIRGDLGNDSILQSTKEGRATRNLIHTADPEESQKEIALWFKPEEIYDRQ